METREHQKESKPMVTEVASIPVKAGQEEAFIRVFKTAIVPVYAARFPPTWCTTTALLRRLPRKLMGRQRCAGSTR